MSNTHHPGSPDGPPREEPVAIVGMACRFPGSKDLAGYWRQLLAAENAVVEGPPGSVIGRPGRQFPQFAASNEAIRFGAYVEDLDLFDAEFFRISPIEAQMLDPQQRMMLEVSWWALEDAAIDPGSLKGSRTGVYAGISIMDYRDMAISDPGTSEAAAGLYAATGNALNTAIGRVSFVLGLEGPSMAIDTACSSSLVAIHQAVAGLQRGEADLVLAGGVHAQFAGRPLELRANAGMLSPTGQCWTFDAAADGFVSGEGCGLIVLKRLSDAQADGDRIWAVIPGSAVNQDGASQGLTVPSAPSQEKAMEAALARAGASPSDVDYLETHGTGTIVGDPIELHAAAAVYGRERDAEHPLLVGSVKTNIGHLGPAAGVAGLIKAVLAMRHGVIPRHLNFSNPNPNIDWDRLPVRVTDGMTDWPLHPDRPRLAGVNSFGWSGTNGHVLVQGYDELEAPAGAARASFPASVRLPVKARTVPGEEPLGEPGTRETRFLPLSARSPEALREVAGRYLSWLDEETDPDLSDLAWTAAVGRSHFAHRAGVVFSEAAQLRQQLEDLAAGEGGGTPRAAHKVAFVFTGQASQWPGMGRALYEREPVFRSVLDRCDRLLSEDREVSLLDVMFGENGTDGLLDEPTWTQPAIYSLECALVALWESLGVRPSVVVGHSLGEIAAARAAGGFTLEQGLRYASARGTLMGATRSDGAMAAVFAPPSRVAEAVADHNAGSNDADLSVAVDNGAQQVVSGPAAELDAVLARFEAEGVKTHRLRRSPAYHSALIEPALDELEAAVREIAPSPPAPSVPLVSNITGRLLDPDERMDAAYWRRHAREPVAFRASVETLAEMGVDAVVEIGPHAVLGPVVSMIWPASALAGFPPVLASLRRPPRDAEEPPIDTSGGFTEAVAGAWEAGLEIEFEGLFAGEARRRITLPGYPFQRVQHWVRTSKRRHKADGHPLLGVRHESPRGEVMFETEVFASDPAWLLDHLVYEQVVVPGGLHGGMAVSVALSQGDRPAVVDELQIYSPLMLDEEDPESGTGGGGRTLQFVLDGSDDLAERPFEIFTKGEGEEAWTLHAGGRLSSGRSDVEPLPPLDPEALKAGLTPQDPVEFYAMRSATGIYLGPSYHTIESAWAREGESLATLALNDSVDATGMELHPLLLDGCFQVLSLARHHTVSEQGAVYMPFGWQRLWVAGPMPTRLLCHATVRTSGERNGADAASSEPPEVVTGDVRFYSTEGAPLGGLFGFTVKRATRGALLASRAGMKDLLYEVAWREQPLDGSVPAADFLASPATVAGQSRTLAEHLAERGVEAADRVTLLRDLQRLSQAYVLSALEGMGWQRRAEAEVSPEALRRELNVVDEHRRLFRRLLAILSEADILSRSDGGYVVAVGAGDPLPDEALADPETLAERLRDKHPHGSNELGLLCRCGPALAEVLQGSTDPMALMFSDEGPGAAGVYLQAPANRSANRMLGDAVEAAVSDLPEDRRLRVPEVGAGTGSATEAVLPRLPSDRVDYTFTDISAGFFSQAEERFAATGALLEYRRLDIEADPAAQGIDAHAYDLVIAANVLHATRDLGETLSHCRDLLAPSGQLVALEGLRHRTWQDLTFGLLDGWWRFTDIYRTEHAFARPDEWRRALGDTGFSDVEFLGTRDPDTDEHLGSSVILARGPADVAPAPGAWVVAADGAGTAEQLAVELASRDQTVLLVRAEGEAGGPLPEVPGVTTAALEPSDREAWRSLLEGLPEEPPLRGVVHLNALDGHGASATTEEMADDVTHSASTALALAQGVIDAGVGPTQGVWFVTRGAQVLEQDLLQRMSGQLAGAALWGFGKTMSWEASHLQPRLIDLDPSAETPAASELAHELLFADSETLIAHRGGVRRAARLIRPGTDDPRLALPEDPEWVVGPEDPEAGLTTLRAKPRTRPDLAPGEVRVAVEAMGLNFVDALMSIGAVSTGGEIGRELVGRVVETGEEVEGLAAGDLVAGMGFGSFTPEIVTNAALVAPAPAGLSTSALATVPICFVTADLAFRTAELQAGERVLIHAGAGGVGLAAIQLAQAAGAEVFATASAAKQSFLRSLGVAHVFDSRETAFGDEILRATDGDGVHVVLNSLTSEGFIEASLACLGTGGRFVEIGKRGIWSQREMSASRPDVAYSVLDVDELKRTDPVRAGASLTRIMDRLAAGELSPLPHTVWPLCEMESAMDAMRAARHIGKNVLRMPPLAGGDLRPDRAYLVTGGLGGIGCAVARWLAEQGAGTVVLNGRREPDPEAEAVIRELREAGANVQVEIADVTDFAAVDALLARIDEGAKSLGGVIHSVGVLSDGVIENQTWDRFEQVLWPKVLGAWHLHQATRTRDLDLFVLFSSGIGVVGNPGQSNHSAANAFLDQLAAHRRGLGLPGQSIAWGAWSGIGEAEEQRERIRRRFDHTAAEWITPEQGIEALDRLVRQDVTAPMVTATDWSIVAEEFGTPPPFFDELLATRKVRRRPTEEPAASSGLMAQLREAPSEEKRNLLEIFIQQELQSVLHLPSPPSATVGFFDVGMDSLMAVELRNRLNRAFAGEYTTSNTIVFDYPSTSELAGHLAGEIEALTGAPSPVPEKPVARPRPTTETDQEGIAIVGMACRFPGAPDVATYWEQLLAGADLVTEGRTGVDYWLNQVGDPEADHPAYRWGGYVGDLELFDARFFGLRPIAAEAMDPQQRMLLETSWQALEDAGIDPEDLRGSRTGVFAGLNASEYRDLMIASGSDGGSVGTMSSTTVGRVAYTLGLMGPALPFQLQCAASLAAVHAAATALERGEVDMALAGGVNAIFSPTFSKLLLEHGLLTSTGRCATFDASAEGYVRGEGCGVVLLKRLSEAEADGDRIWAVISGSAVNHNGTAAGMTMPSGPAQEQVIEEALSRAGIEPADVDYLEAHGAGSEIGDSIEVQAAATVYGRERDADRPLLIGTAKTNMGHLESAAGIAGLIKVVLAMRHAVIPKHLHFETPNPEVDWDRLPVRVTSERTHWPPANGRPARAGVSAFGFSGTNVHVVVEGYAAPDGDSEPGARQTRILPLSAKSETALRSLAGRFLGWVDGHYGAFESDDSAAGPLLSDLAWTAGTGRSHFPHRAAVVFRDGESLASGLRALAEANGAPKPQEATNVAFVYAGRDSPWTGMGEVLYRTEPVVRAILDRCDDVLREQRADSLLEIMFGRTDASGNLDDPAWACPAIYALECSLTALWSSIGIRPSVVVGFDAGELAAAHAARIFSLEDGLRLAAAAGESAAAEGPVVLERPSLTMIRGVDGRPLAVEDALAASFWLQRDEAPAKPEACAATLADRGVEVVLEIGPRRSVAPAIADAWPTSDAKAAGDAGSDSAPLALASLRPPSGDAVEDLPGGGFLEAAAAAYEAGLPVSFAGLFAGENRRRISLPGYPFERRRHWVDPPSKPV
ncbi:MAG: SDR family NAD(P)-dependent oxidoreductase [Acidobacteriota bacterium]|nr:SDR family NAD(P)-dependent oxidoreductase [Acidobacteriota bacterium]MDE3266559.1 SDR family NAD(P)-dependent oxidoreductase [Acidobacteriota bacterium]